jgi:putative hydrolase of the HAD superfamily
MRIVFDFAGVLFHWQPRALLQRELPQRAGSTEQARHWEQQIFEGYAGDWRDFDRGALDTPELVQRIARRTGLDRAEVQRVVDAVPHELQPVPATVALLRRLHEAGQALYFLSNMPAPYADHLDAANAFIGCFRDGVYSGRVHEAKPDAAIFKLAAERFGAAPGQLVLLDDQTPNVRAAQALGWNALQFRDAAQAEAELRERGWV